MNKQEYDILRTIVDYSYTNQRILAELSGHSLGVVNKSLKRLTECGYLDEQAHLTMRSRELFQSRKPRNAIILAAGFGMRMVPINMTTPKAFLEVNGERLIERVIRQLHDVGVKDITVVVGFMKDHFEYLIDEYGVSLSYSADYASTNSLHSLSLVADKIDNTYIIPCDIWCDRNPFDRYELYSWYMVSDLVDDNSDVRVNRKKELVKVASNTAGNGMVGISYLTGDEAEVVKGKIQKYALDSDYNEKFWEEALYVKDRMVVQAKVVHSSDVVEINTYEQLRDLDSSSNQLRSDAIHTICKELKCHEDEIVNITVLKKGMTNRSFMFRVAKGEKEGKYIMRIPGEGTDSLIDRKAEAGVYECINGLEFCDDPVYINPNNGYKITKYIEGVRCCNPENEDDLRLCMKKLRKFHNFKVDGKPLVVPHTFDLMERIDFYESLWNGTPSVYRDYTKTKENCISLIPFIEKHRDKLQLTHIDAVPDNFLFDPNVEGELHIQLTDWEYAGMQDPHVDIAMFCIYSMYGKEQIDRLIDIYFEEEGGCSKAIRAKIYAYIAVCGLLWSNWCEYKRNLGVEFGEYSLYQYRYAKDFYRYAAELMKELGEPLKGERDN
ncbi:MAG: NTP transferase domain-containing protein [Mogibacterium sp.]|nr:NTP transferase domain-containing protein [Mogibacterium sp.]